MAEETIKQENVEMEEINDNEVALAPIAGGIAILGLVALGAVKAFKYFKSKKAAALQVEANHIEINPEGAPEKVAEEDNTEK